MKELSYFDSFKLSLSLEGVSNEIGNTCVIYRHSTIKNTFSSHDHSLVVINTH